MCLKLGKLGHPEMRVSKLEKMAKNELKWDFQYCGTYTRNGISAKLDPFCA